MSDNTTKSAEDWVPVALSVPSHWSYVEFEEAFDAISTNGMKIPEAQYAASGRFPIVDQGKSFIGGYTDNENKLVNQDGAVIVFGDHTRCFKLISFPFAPGADGTKVLRPAPYVVPKFAYYGCLSLKLPDRGYSRHYSFLKKSKFPIAPIGEQRRIVAKIEELFSELDKGVESLMAAREQLKAYRQLILMAAFEGKLSADWKLGRASRAEDSWTDVCAPIPQEEIADLPALPPGWIYARLGDFIERIDAGRSFRCDERIPGPDEIGVAKVSAVTWGVYDEDESKTCMDPDKIKAEYFIQKGDFLFSRANTIELVGACVIAEKVGRIVMLSDKTLRIAFSRVAPRYLLYYLRSHLGRKEIMRRSTGNQDSMRNIGQDRIKSIITPMCAPEEAEYIQERIEEIVSSVDQTEREIESQLQRAIALRQSILRQAFSGQLVAPGPADEPASVLLARISAKRGGSRAAKRRNTKNGKKEAA